MKESRYEPSSVYNNGSKICFPSLKNSKGSIYQRKEDRAPTDPGDILDNKDEFSDVRTIRLRTKTVLFCCILICKIFIPSYSIASAVKPMQVQTKLVVVVTLYPGRRKLPKLFPNQNHICI